MKQVRQEQTKKDREELRQRAAKLREEHQALVAGTREAIKESERLLALIRGQPPHNR
jgi:hypothetical protein